jgi:hypothetical protein
MFNTITNFIDQSDKFVGGYNGLIALVGYTMFFKIALGIANAINDHSFNANKFIRGAAVQIFLVIVLLPVPFVALFTKNDNLIMGLSEIYGIFVIIWGLLGIYHHWTGLTGLKINRLDKVLADETSEVKETIEIPAVEETVIVPAKEIIDDSKDK